MPVILEKAKKKFSDAKSTTYFKSKESFGDADILVLVDKDIDFNIKEWIIEEFGSKEVVVNGGVYSFEFNELQVDFILTPLRNWETSQVYFSYNDLHNLIGKVAHRFGLKWGFDGLKYTYNSGGKELGVLYVSKNYEQVLSFLGFDVDRYNLGFNNLDEIFDFVISSKYFNPWLFDFEIMNRTNRERDMKRTTYASFVERVAPLKEKTIDSYHYFYSDKKVYLGLIDFHFPGFLKEYRQLEKKEERKIAISELFNGRIVMEQYKLEGKSLGEALNNFKSYFASNDLYEDYILETNNTAEILQKFAQINKLS